MSRYANVSRLSSSNIIRDLSRRSERLYQRQTKVNRSLRRGSYSTASVVHQPREIKRPQLLGNKEIAPSHPPVDMSPQPEEAFKSRPQLVTI